MGRTDARSRWRAGAAALLATGIVVGPVAVPAAADGSIREKQWHLDAMHASEMWKTSKGQGITVAIVDGGFKLDHPDLAGQFLSGKDFSGGSGGVGSYTDGHGTEMASLIAGTGASVGGTGAYGLAPAARILPLKINNGSATAASPSDFLDQIGQAVNYAVDQGAKVINISQGMDEDRFAAADVAKLNGILAQARARGSLVVASVGNEAQSGNPVSYPGGLPNVVGAGAVDHDVVATSESEQGPQVILAAPGMDIFAACVADTGYCKSHGTSDAAALVSASAALVWSVHKDWTANQVLRVLINTASKPTDGSVRNNDVGYGVVRPRVALTDPGDPGPADVSPVPAADPVPAASPSASAGSPAPAASASVPAGSPSAVAVGAPTVAASSGSSGSGGVLPVVGGGAAGLVVVAAVVVLVRRRRRAAA
ncbi:S8 family serine peptidase [Kitasatospora sp. NPDC096077]|uniref:S8 family serine peptidase n=1 Tax=Kitasatospora sp. NPDC096077 TaxID=3155544 RepID=UPI00332D08AF